MMTCLPRSLEIRMMWRPLPRVKSLILSLLAVIISDPVPGPDQRVATPPLVIIKRVLTVLKQNIICRCKKSNKCSRKVDDLKHF